MPHLQIPVQFPSHGSRAELCPAGHSKHEEEPGSAENVPGGQFSHVFIFSVLKVPLPHKTHDPELAAFP